MDEIADKGELLVMANLAEQAERYEDMVKAMKSIVVLSEELNAEERNMLSVAYKNVIGARRAAWRIFASLEQKHEGNQNEKELVVGYRETVEKEIQEISDGILELLDTYLIPKAQTSESKVFFHKMKGDYHRYLTEIIQGDDRKGPAEKALDAYKDAEKEAEDLPSTNPISLGLALNFSVFYYEILDSPEKACRLAKKAFDGAVGDLEKSSESQFKESALILQLLRDNLTLWTSEMQEDGGDDDV